MPDSKLGLLLRQKIATGGPLPFSGFMAECLYHPELGYYSGRRRVVGRAGDFFTGVSTGPLFGRLLADGFHQAWVELGRPAAWQIAEQGADRGELAADVLRRLRELDGAAWRGCSYLIVEPLPALQTIQRDTLAAAGFGEKIRQVHSLAELPEKSLRGVFFSNELPDAFPVRRVQFLDGGWREQRVAWDAAGGRFAWQPAPCDAELARLIAEFELPPLEGCCAEVSPLLAGWVGEVASRLAAGLFLTIDYGGIGGELYRAERREGTLRAYRRHRQMTDPLAAPGEQDLTAHVNFSRLIASGRAAGLALREYTDQHHYLVNLGRLRFFREIEEAAAAGGPDATAKLLREYKTLMHPGIMGAAFKVLVMSAG